jgi:hypothetical protein
MNAQHPGGIGAIWELSTRQTREWAKRVMTLLDASMGELNGEEHPAKCTVLQAASLLREHIDPHAAAAAPDEGGRLLAWQARKVRDYVDSHIAGPIRVAELCAHSAQRGALLALLQAHVRSVTPCVRDPASSRVGG